MLIIGEALFVLDHLEVAIAKGADQEHAADESGQGDDQYSRERIVLPLGHGCIDAVHAGVDHAEARIGRASSEDCHVASRLCEVG